MRATAYHGIAAILAPVAASPCARLRSAACGGRGTISTPRLESANGRLTARAGTLRCRPTSTAAPSAVRTSRCFRRSAKKPLKKHAGCGGKLTKVLSSVGIVLKGSGFYKTDNRSGSSGGQGPRETPAAPRATRRRRPTRRRRSKSIRLQGSDSSKSGSGSGSRRARGDSSKSNARATSRTAKKSGEKAARVAGQVVLITAFAFGEPHAPRRFPRF